MSELIGFPMISQRDSDVNADFDCVPTSIAACMEWLTGQKYTGGEIKDAVYGRSYTGGTAATAYVDYCAARGVTLAPINGTGAALVTALHGALAEQHPCLITEPDPYAAGWTHVCAAYKDTANSITVMDPWIDAPVTKSDAVWASQLEFNQIWVLRKTMQQYSEQSADFASWFTAIDANHWKCVKTGKTVQFGIKSFYSTLSTDGQSLPIVGLPLSDEIALTVSGKSVVLQVFERAGVFYDPNHEKDKQPGTGTCALCHLTDSDFLQHIPGLALPAAPTAPVDTSAVEQDINAIADAIAAPVAKALADLKRL